MFVSFIAVGAPPVELLLRKLFLSRGNWISAFLIVITLRNRLDMIGLFSKKLGVINGHFRFNKLIFNKIKI